MIAKLTGIVDSINEDQVIIDVNQVGYLVSGSTRTIGSLEIGAKVVLWIDTWVREDALNLYGFSTMFERDWFRLLVTVQGVGARVALAILSCSDPDEIALALLNEDKGVFTKATGVGAKLATRIVTELKGKAPTTLDLKVALTAGRGQNESSRSIEVISALVNLGYRPNDVASIVRQVTASQPADVSLSDLIRLALKQLGALQAKGI